MSCKTNNPINTCCQPSSITRRSFLIGAGSLSLMGCTKPLWFSDNKDVERYAKALQSRESLRGYWRFNNDFIDTVSGKPTNISGTPTFSASPLGGSAISLDPNSYLSVAEAEHLRDSAATLQFFFKLEKRPSGKDDLVLMAQTNDQDVRYIVGIKNDLSSLLYRNEREKIVTRIDLPTAQPIEVGRWYHFAITSFDLDIRVYVDGYECSLVGGALEFTRKGPKNAPMLFGMAPLAGWASAHIQLDEVACFGQGLTQAEIQQDLIQAGWQDKLDATGVMVASVNAQRDAVRENKVNTMLQDPALTAKGSRQVYKNEKLEAINFTVGGIGAGAIQFNGKGMPGIWQIATNFSETFIEDCFLAVRAQAEGQAPIVRALQTQAAGAFTAMSALEFSGEYPFAHYKFNDSQLPVTIETEIFNPFIPMDLKNSAIPCAIYTLTVSNPSQTTVSVDLLASQKNLLGYDQKTKHKDNGFGGNQNKIIKSSDSTRVHMQQTTQTGADLVLMTNSKHTTGLASWTNSANLHNAFLQSGQLSSDHESEPSALGETTNCALSVPLKLAPGERKSVTFVLTWYFSDTQHAGSQQWETRKGQMYTNWWPNALAVADYLDANLTELTERTRRFHDTLYASNLPVWLLDRLSSQAAVLRSQTCFWSKDGYFGAWEGTKSDDGCCPGNCTHVWHYAQLHARLFPELGRMMREQDFDFQLESGLVRYRHTGKHLDAADGFFGTILNVYREYQCSEDPTWLSSLWPKVKKGMEWAIENWDPMRDGFMQNKQHNTLDGAIMGCSSWIGSLYLSALEACARMAETMQETATAAEYRRIRASGKKLQNERLWNGEYYIQQAGKKRVQDYLDGCHIDQILGEWWADQLDIDRNYPRDRATKALASLLKYNFRSNFYGQSLKPRQYCELSDGGTKMITWPNNPQPIPGMKYGDEVMTGFEYGAGASMIQNDMLHQGLMLIKIIAERYDGRLRTEGVTDMDTGPRGTSGNPFGDDECGKYYGRSLSVWSVLLALQGFIYHGPDQRIGFKPKIHTHNHQSFFSTAAGYGLYSQKQSSQQLTAKVELSEGYLDVREIILKPDSTVQKAQIAYASNGQSQVVASQFKQTADGITIKLAKPLRLSANQALAISLSLS